MDDEDNDYEIERQAIIAENRALLDSLGFEAGGSAKLNLAKPKPVAKSTNASKKRKTAPVKVEEGPRRRSGRLLGMEATEEVLQERAIEEEKKMEEIRIINRKTRDQVMKLGDMLEDAEEGEKESLTSFLKDLSLKENPRRFPDSETSGKDAYAESSKNDTEFTRLKSAFKNMQLRANAKVTTERVYSMVVHPEPTKCVVCVGDKQGTLGIWDALGQPSENVKAEEDDTGVKADDGDYEGNIWRIQAHARNAITSIKIDPVAGDKIYTSAYDCSLRSISFLDGISREIFSFPNDDMLITHFDITPDGQQAWIADKDGGISHADFRESKSASRRRWVVSADGRSAKLGGISINPLMPHLLVTASNDRHVRIWDSRHLSAMTPSASEKSAIPIPKLESQSDTAEHVNTQPDSNIESERTLSYMESAKGKGLLRGSWLHGKSCSAAYWDPWGRRVLTTSYDDKLRVWNLEPSLFLKDQPLDPKIFTPASATKHDCQTGRWLTILRAQWSLNMDYTPHFTVGNMKRSLDVMSASGEKVVSLWTDGVTAVPAVTNSHPNRVDHVVGGNTSGRIQLWTSAEST